MAILSSSRVSHRRRSRTLFCRSLNRLSMAALSPTAPLSRPYRDEPRRRPTLGVEIAAPVRIDDANGYLTARGDRAVQGGGRQPGLHAGVDRVADDASAHSGYELTSEYLERGDWVLQEPTAPPLSGLAPCCIEARR